MKTGPEIKKKKRKKKKEEEDKEGSMRWQNRRLALVYQDIPQKFWGEAMNTSCHIGN